MKVLFFDVDGPMVPARAFFLPNNIVPRYGWEFDKTAVHMLNFLGWAVPDLRVVIGSHRVGMRSPFDKTFTDTKNSWERIFRENGLTLKIHTDWITVRDDYDESGNKVKEITGWLKAHPRTTHWVTFDDEIAGYTADTTEVHRSMVHLCGEDYLNGISWKDLQKALKYLGISGSLDDLLDKYRVFHLAQQNVQTTASSSTSRIIHPESRRARVDTASKD